MGANLGTPAYQGNLRNDSVTVAEALRAAGYRTCMAGRNAPLQDRLVKECEHWAESVGVLDWREAFPRLQAAWGMESASG